MSQVIIRLTLSSNAVGPFSIYTASTATTPIKTGVTRDQIIAGVVLDLPGSVAGIQYLILVVNKQVGCNNETVSKQVVVYESAVTPTVTPTLTVTQLLLQQIQLLQQTLRLRLRPLQRQHRQ